VRERVEKRKGKKEKNAKSEREGERKI